MEADLYFELDHLLLVKLLTYVAILLAGFGALVGFVQWNLKMAKELFVDALGFMVIAIVVIILHRL